MRRILAKLDHWQPVVRENTPAKFACRLSGVWCPTKKGIHESNHTVFNCWFGVDSEERPCIAHCHFKCLDPQCPSTQWDPDGPMDLFAFPANLVIADW